MERHRERIELTDTFLDVSRKLGEGNPGALNVLAEVHKHGPRIDPDAFDPLLILLNFDSLGLYGADIWMLYKDVCGCDLALTVGVTRAWQLGLISRDDLFRAVRSRNRADPPIDLAAVRAGVKGQLERFDFDFDPKAAAGAAAPLPA